MYVGNRLSSYEIGARLGVSPRKIDYWLKKYNIQKRTISEATYVKKNPDGDPFVFRKPKSIDEATLYGLGLGLFWGEGTKSDKVSLRLGNSDPRLIKCFMKFLIEIFGANTKKMRFGLQVFSDIRPREALDFWVKQLGVKSSSFQKVVVTPTRGRGTYRVKSKYGVLTLYFHNKKLRTLMGLLLENFSKKF